MVLDGFAPSKNPDMMERAALSANVSFYQTTKGPLRPFTAASAVRKGLENVGFDITKRKGFGKNENVSLVKNA